MIMISSRIKIVFVTHISVQNIGMEKNILKHIGTVGENGWVKKEQNG